MKNTKKWMSLFAAGVMVVGSMVGNVGSVSAKTMEKVNPFPYILHLDEEVGFEDYIKSLTSLSETEKKQLLDSEEKINAWYDEVDKLSDKINGFYESEKLQALFEEYDNIMEENRTLWDKLDGNVSDEQLSTLDMKDFIKASEALTEDEKATLLAAQEKLDAVENKILKAYEEVDKLTEALRAEGEGLYSKIEEEGLKNESIWNKVEFGVMPY